MILVRFVIVVAGALMRNTCGMIDVRPVHIPPHRATFPDTAETFMKTLFAYLASHPLLAAALVLILIGIVASVVKKLVKIALILLVIFAVTGGVVFNISQKELADTGRQLLEKAGDTGKDLLEDAGSAVSREVRKRAHELTADTAASDTAHPARKSPSQKAPRTKHARN